LLPSCTNTFWQTVPPLAHHVLDQVNQC
jgi:hypothetical protein